MGTRLGRRGRGRGKGKSGERTSYYGVGAGRRSEGPDVLETVGKRRLGRRKVEGKSGQ